MESDRIVPEISARRAKRAISSSPVADDVIHRLLTAATLAPSCANNQPWRFLVMNDEESLAKGRALLTPGNYWAKTAPALLAVITRKPDDCVSSEGRDYALFDCGLTAQNLMLQATREGLIAHPMAGFDATALKKAFNLPEDTIPMVMIAIGHPGDESGLSEKHIEAEHAPRNRKPLEDVLL